MPLSPAIQDCVDTGLISNEQALALSYDQRTNLESEPVRACIANGTITLDQAFALTYGQRTNLKSEPVRACIANGTITLDQAFALTYSQRTNLESEPVHACIANGTITLDQAFALTYDQRTNLESEPVRACIANGTITLDQAFALTYDQRTNLESEPVRACIANGTITLDQAFALTYDQRRALADQETRERLIAGELTIEDIIGGPVQHHAPHVHVPAINDGQSTHNAAVHQAVSASATKLMDRYGLMIAGPGLENKLAVVQTQVSNLSDESAENKAAKRCIQRLTAGNYTFTDPTSRVTTRQLLALTFLAISDASQRMGSLEDARAQYVQGLYEIQRGYNLNDTGVDTGGADRSICAGGTFNKLIEKLQGIHPDCEIRFITRETAALKLPKVVKEEAMQYLSQLANPQSKAELLAFTKLIAAIKEDGLEVIYDQIKPRIADRMFDEFGSLYRGRADHSFTGLVDAGEYTALDNLSQFQEQIQNSKGYHEYCSEMLRRSTGGGLFFSSSRQSEQERLSAARHDSPEAQREYDQQYGLVLKS